MRTVIDLPDEQIESLRTLCARQSVSRAELIRRAIAEFLARHETLPDDEAFGIWKASPVDARTLEDRLRDEWTR